MSKIRRQYQNAALLFFLNKAAQALKENPDDCDKTFFNTTNFHRFDVQLFKRSSPQLNVQTNSDSAINTLLLHFLIQHLSLDTFHEQKNTDAEKLKNEVIKVFTQTDFDNSSDTEVSQKYNFLDPHG